MLPIQPAPDTPDASDVPEPAPAIRLRPWPDPVIDTLGHDPQSLYVETFWLPTLGPTTLLLARHIARHFETNGAGPEDVIELPVVPTSHALGLGPRQGRNSPLFRSFGRLVQFDLAYAHSDGVIAVRRSFPPVTRRHARRLPAHLQAEHEEWMARSDGPRSIAQRRARRTAFVLAELGTDPDVVERSLHHLGFQPGLCRETATWATSRHRELDRAAEAEMRHPSSLPGARTDAPSEPVHWPEGLDAA